MGITASLHTRPCSAVVGLTGAQFLKCSIDGLNLSLLCVCVCALFVRLLSVWRSLWGNARRPSSIKRSQKCPAEARSALLLVAFSVSDLFVSPSFSECIFWKSGRSLGVGLPASFLVCAAAHVAFGPEEEN